MYVVVRTGAKQYRVEPGQEFLVEKLEAEPGTKVSLEDVLFFADEKDVSVGKPILPMKVECMCVSHEKGKKLHTVKYKRRKHYRRKLGHRQWYTRLKVENIAKGAG